MSIDLTEAQRKALDEHHGFVEDSQYVLISKDVYRRMMGVGSDQELAESLAAIEEGLADIEAGRTRPFREVLAELGSSCQHSQSD